mmetsp:Transcript_2182/g.5491  ORF Transcript_2182/g.5491 Transcript_2182/m.5491 type:complete len:178 (-) Transcript_2182:382-915(-)
MPQTLSRNCLGSSNSNSSSSKVATLLLLASCSSLVAAGGGSREGRCSGSGYMSVGWSGMSRDKCIERAAEVHKDTSQCSFLSYSSSSQPQQQSQFCFCFKDCSELAYPSKEVWETMNPEEAKATSDSSVSATVVIAAIAAFAGLLVVTTAVVVCYIRHHRRIRAATSLRDASGVDGA